MYSYSRLPASSRKNGLDGLDIFGMRSYWNALKTKIADLQNLGPKINAYWARISYAQQKLVARGDTAGANVLGDELLKIADDIQKWSKVKDYIDTYLPEWMKLDEGATVQPGSGVGMVPFILAGMALVALAYCVNTGLALLQDYMYKSQLTQDVIDGKINTGQMRDILSIPRDEGILEKVVGSVGVGAAIGIPTVLLVGGGLYIALQMGLLKGILGSVFGGSSSSSQSSGG